ncbi:MAG: sigma-54 dependent transcriptional regulator [Polyangia bacterium]|jgi:two-component system response regulator HydG|nr:sigma-54 dependent transcriptional regulator [Polyangia bacterium]
MGNQNRARLLVVDDHREMAAMLAEQFQELGFSADVATSGVDALRQVELRLPDAVITDLRMEQVDGLDVLDAIRRIDPKVPVIVMTAFGAVESAIEAIRRGAYHYLAKPFPFEVLLLYVERALQERQLREEHEALVRLARERGGQQRLIGESAPMQALLRMIDMVAPSDAPVLILGESGTGKEIVARTLHDLSPRRERRFVPVNCAALPEALLESELFGHVRGAFTGATGPRRGLFVEADGGTLFLDEIAEMPSGLQAKLLRVLEDGEVRPVGADACRRVDVRLLAATHRNLERHVSEGTFRQDLYYRLNVVPLRVPPLRERLEDLPLLTLALLARARQGAPGSTLERLSPDALLLLEGHKWPGNVRELDNLMRRLALLVRDSVADPDDVRRFGALETPASEISSPGAQDPVPDGSAAPHGLLSRAATSSMSGEDAISRAFETQLASHGDPESLPQLRDVEWAYLSWVIDRCEGNKARASRILGIDVSTIHRKLRCDR